MGNDKYPHTNDVRSCIHGREQYISGLPAKDQLRELIIHERLSKEVADQIWALSVAREKTPLEVMQEEGLRLTSSKG